MKLRNRVIAAGVTLALGIAPVMAYASPQSELAEASAQLDSLGAELNSLQEDLATRTSDLEMTAYHIGEKEAAITQTQGELAEAKGILSGRMRSSYKSGPSSLLSVVMGADSLNDIISRIYYMDKVAMSDAETINKVRTLEARLQTEKDDLEKTRADQQKAVDELQVQVDDYTSKVEEARAYYDALDEQVQQQIAAQQAAAANTNIQAAMEAVGETAQQGGTAQSTEQTGETATANQNGDEAASSASESSGASSGGGTSYAPSGGGLGSAYAAIGSPYVYGADGPSSFDCSGLVCYCYGYARGRTTYDMISSLQSTGSWKTSMDQLSVGDLVFTDEGHVGIYTGGGTMIHAPRPGKSVCETSVWSFIGGGSY
ncbi:MAG: C40 family peptidase [Atopobiaceae bacterium]|nr:C40 family peptidase [Atopobiaceae bacterium]